MAKYVRIYFRDKRITTLNELIDSEKLINISADDFLNVEDPFTGTKNRESLFKTYTKQQKKSLSLNSPEDITNSTKIYPPCVLYSPIDNVTNDVISYDSQFTQSDDFDAFLDENIKQIINNPGYSTDKFTKDYPRANVWLWSKSIEDISFFNPGEDFLTTVNGVVLNLTPYLINLQTGVTANGGNFSIEIAFMASKATLSSNESNTQQTTGFLPTKPLANVNKNEFLHRENIFEQTVNLISGEEKSRNEPFWQHAISVNDVIFIEFEKLKISRTLFDESDIILTNQDLPDNVFDMIGLVDKVEVSTNPNDVTIKITGRDLMKLLLDDGSFFFMNSSTSDDLTGIFNNNDDKVGDGYNTFQPSSFPNSDIAASRFVANGVIIPFLVPEARTIESVMEVLISTLSNIRVCPDELFSYYGDKRTQFQRQEVKKISE